MTIPEGKHDELDQLLIQRLEEQLAQALAERDYWRRCFRAATAALGEAEVALLRAPAGEA